jgi:hypothetical protein
MTLQVERTMNKIVLVLLAGVFSGAALAQQYKWVDKDGKVRYGDVPPPGVKATPLRAPPGPSAPPPAPKAAAGKDKDKQARKGPLTPAEQEKAFRERQEEARKAAEKSAQEEQQAAAKRENCERAKESLRTLESGQRVARTDAKGERYFLEDAQIAEETAKARQAVQQACN